MSVSRLAPLDVSLAIETAYAPSAAVAQRIADLSWTHSHYGYRRMRALLTEESWQVRRRQVQRVRRIEGL